MHEDSTQRRWRIDPKAAKQDRDTMLKLRAVQFGSPRRSETGVPYLQAGPFNVCWFWQRGFYRVFAARPTQGESPYRLDFKTARAVRAFLRSQWREYEMRVLKAAEVKP